MVVVHPLGRSWLVLASRIEHSYSPWPDLCRLSEVIDPCDGYIHTDNYSKLIRTVVRRRLAYHFYRFLYLQPSPILLSCPCSRVVPSASHSSRISHSGLVLRRSCPS